MVEVKILSEKLEENRWPYYLLFPFVLCLVLWVIIKKKFCSLFHKKKDIGLLLFDGIGRDGKVVKKNAAGWKAVDLIYNHRFGENRNIGGWLDDFWFNSLNCQAARNRFRLAKRELEKAMLKFSLENEVRAVSFAAGTGQIESETVARVKKRKINIKMLLIDKEPEAIKRAQDYVAFNGVSKEIKIINSDIKHALGVVESFNPYIIAMIAFLDYLQDEEAVRFISRLYQIIPEKGYFITSNTMPNIEMFFVKWVVEWPLIYRNPQKIANIIKESGFNHCEIINEPLRIQSIVVARKLS